MIINFFKGDEKIIIDKLASKPDVQKIFITKIINDTKLVDDEIIEKYIKILAESKSKEERKMVLPELKKQGRYPPKCLQICERNNIKDAWAFLEEMRGNFEGIKKAIDLRNDVINTLPIRLKNF